MSVFFAVLLGVVLSCLDVLKTFILLLGRYRLEGPGEYELEEDEDLGIIVSEYMRLFVRLD